VTIRVLLILVFTHGPPCKALPAEGRCSDSGVRARAFPSARPDESRNTPTIVSGLGYGRLKANAMVSIGQWLQQILNVTWGVTACVFAYSGK